MQRRRRLKVMTSRVAVGGAADALAAEDDDADGREYRQGAAEKNDRAFLRGHIGVRRHDGPYVVP